MEDNNRDDRSPGYKFNDWGLRGVQIGLEIGSRELQLKTLVISRRDAGKKSKEKTTATNRVVPFDEHKKDKCIVCGKETDIVAYFAKSY